MEVETSCPKASMVVSAESSPLEIAVTDTDLKRGSISSA